MILRTCVLSNVNVVEICLISNHNQEVHHHIKVQGKLRFTGTASIFTSAKSLSNSGPAEKAKWINFSGRGGVQVGGLILELVWFDIGFRNLDNNKFYKWFYKKIFSISYRWFVHSAERRCNNCLFSYNDHCWCSPVLMLGFDTPVSGLFLLWGTCL